MPKANIVLVDDEEALRTAVSRVLTMEGYRVTGFSSAEDCLAHLDPKSTDLLITDLVLPQQDGIELLRRIKENHPDIEIILITAHATIERAVEAMRMGAYDFIEKPIDPNALLKTISKAVEKRRLVIENAQLRAQLQTQRGEESLVGNSPAMVAIKKLIRQVAPSDVSVLIQGESGTGKEIVADILHSLSARREKPIIKISCAAIPETLLESELFGYEKGAFTGAVGAKPGKFELADGGTLFLDEIAEMSGALQAKLLRVLQDGRLQRLGGTRDIQTDARIVSATHVYLAQAIEEKKFREDLYYRLNVIQIILPPLRDRREDIALLADHFLKKHSARMDLRGLSIAPAAMEQLTRYDWPGNVRELENVVQRALALTGGQQIESFDLLPPPAAAAAAPTTRGKHFVIPFGRKLREIEDYVIAETLKQCGGNKEQAAFTLGISSRTLQRRAEKKGSS